MKKTPLILRIGLGICISVLVVFALMQPMISRGETAALIALGSRGKPYVLGTFGPESYDCSGLAMQTFRILGRELVHSAQFVGYDDQYQTIDDASDLDIGDLIFFDTVKDSDLCDHVGIWLGMNRFVHASSSEMVVMISDFDEDWQARFSWGKRV